MESRLECSGDIPQICAKWGTGLILVWALFFHGLKYYTSWFHYGKFAGDKRVSGWRTNQTFSWNFACLPSFIVPLVLVYRRGITMEVNVVLALPMIIHYLNRSLLFPLFIARGGHRFAMSFMVWAMISTVLNGFIQVNTVLCKPYSRNWIYDFRFIIGLGLWVIGFCVNVHSDYILSNLRKPGETDYKIPRGGLFEYVSGANFFGEIVEWLGFAIACWTSGPAWAFAAFSAAFIGQRGLETHRFYLEKFEDYPKDGKAVIPFVL